MSETNVRPERPLHDVGTAPVNWLEEITRRFKPVHPVSSGNGPEMRFVARSRTVRDANPSNAVDTSAPEMLLRCRSIVEALDMNANDDMIVDEMRLLDTDKT